MRQLQLRNPSSTTNFDISLPKLGIVAHAEELMRYDLIYVSHLLKKNTPLIIMQDMTQPWRENPFVIYFNEFKLGYLSTKTNSLLQRHFNSGKLISARVKRCDTQVHLMLPELIIEITVNNPETNEA